MSKNNINMIEWHDRCFTVEEINLIKNAIHAFNPLHKDIRDIKDSLKTTFSFDEMKQLRSISYSYQSLVEKVKNLEDSIKRNSKDVCVKKQRITGSGFFDTLQLIFYFGLGIAVAFFLFKYQFFTIK